MAGTTEPLGDMTDLEICQITARMCGKEVFDATPEAAGRVPGAFQLVPGGPWRLPANITGFHCDERQSLPARAPRTAGACSAARR